MTKEELKKIIAQIKKYDITNSFCDKEEVDKWLTGLNDKQIKNFISLNINPSDIVFPKYYLIDTNLLNYDDYVNRVTAMSKIKNGEGCWHLFDRLCSLNFLNSKNYYKDMEKISRADTIRYALWVINEDVFINSPYHDEDLELIVTAKDNSDDDCDWLVSEALAMVAGDKNSINSPYHREDMKLIASSGSDCLQMSGAFPDRGINKLAINEVSLKDKYHLENMEILSKCPVSDRWLYDVMTNTNIINGKFYRKEIELLMNAKSEVTSIAMYNYITNPKNRERNTLDFYDAIRDAGLDYSDIFLLNRRGCVSGKLDKNYLNNLELLSRVPDIYVMFIENIFTNKDNLDSGHQKFDVDLLLSITDKDIFMDLFRLMTDKVALFSKHHEEDAKLISKTTNKEIRKLLLQKATDKYSVDSEHHRYDMEYITKLDLGNIRDEVKKKMRYYLFTGVGIKDEKHVNMLEKLSQGIIVEKKDIILEHLNKLEEVGFEETFIDQQTIIEDNKKSSRPFTRIRKLFGRR